jgi:hypothetical protein
MKGFIERREGVLDGARAFGGEQHIDGTPGGSQAVVLNFFEGGHVGLGGPDGGLRDGNLLRGENGGENERDAEEKCYAGC